MLTATTTQTTPQTKPTSGPIIRMVNVNMWYDKGKPAEVWALRNVNLEIKKGEYLAFFGPSGCGKTTLLYTLAGIEQPQDGQVFINNKDIVHLSKRELAIYRQIGVGIVFQQFNLIPSITVLENVALPMSFLGISLGRRQEEAAKLLDRLGIKHLAGRYPYELSGGQQQRVGIARALANNPPIIVADEPLGNLDSENAKNVLEFLKELNEKDGRTIIMVTHEAWSLRDCQRIFYMKDGAILKTETPKSPKSITKSVSSYLYKELHPELSSDEVMAKSLSHLLLRGYSVEEVKRFEFFLNQRFKNQIDSELFASMLDKPFRDGGVGLWKKKVQKIAKWTEGIITERKNIEKTEKKLEANPETPLKEEVAQIRGWLLEEYDGKVSDLQKLQLDEIVSGRLRAMISSQDFRKTLYLSKKQFGVGFSYRAAQRLTEKLDTVLGGGETENMEQEA